MSKIKYRKEWPRLIKTGRRLGLHTEQLYFLLALRESEAGKENNEFNVKDVQDTTYDKQIEATVQSILKNEERWQDYIRDQSFMDFTSFFMYFGGPYGNGWHKSVKLSTIKQLEATKERIKNEFTEHD